jgi:hypothetical protein
VYDLKIVEFDLKICVRRLNFRASVLKYCVYVLKIVVYVLKICAYLAGPREDRDRAAGIKKSILGRGRGIGISEVETYPELGGLLQSNP